MERIKLYNEKIKKIALKTTLQIKIINIIILLFLTYIFTIFYMKITLSIVLSIITFIVLFYINKLSACIFIIIYIIIIVRIINRDKNALGNPILQTNIIKNTIPYNCLSNSLMIPNTEFKTSLYGGNFTYSYWIYVNNSPSYEYNWNNYRYNEWKSVFYRGSQINADGDLSTITQFPGFWLKPILNNMVIVFQNNSFTELLEIENIPFNTWVNILLIVETKSVALYINGSLDRTLNLNQNVAIMDSYNLYLTSDVSTSIEKNKCGFAGCIAELTYYNYALTYEQIKIVYSFYKKIIEHYQRKIDLQIKYTIPGLITNSDYDS